MPAFFRFRWGWALMILALLLVGGYGKGKGSGPAPVQLQLPPPPEGETAAQNKQEKGQIQVVLYFADPSGNYLVPEKRPLPKVEGLARATVEELIKGPAPGSPNLPTIPKGTVLRDINVRPDGLCRVDFSRELIKNHSGGSLGETLTVYSIVNTLTQFPTIKQVQILVEGQLVLTIAGHVDVSSAMTRNESLIKP